MNTPPPRRPLLLDGATGTNLLQQGMPPGACTETWVLDHPRALQDLQRAYLEAGSDLLLAPTFGANRLRLRQQGLSLPVIELNERLVALTREAAGGRCLVAGDISATGEQVEPFGDLPFLELVDCFAEQAFALKRAGVDLIVCETMTSLTECRAALLAARETGLPVYVSVTVDDSGRTPQEADPMAVLITMQGLGASAFGINCSDSSQGLEEQFLRLAPQANIPLLAKPSAGLSPDRVLSPREFARTMERLLLAGVTIAGGCCQTTPAHIRELRRLLDSFDFSAVQIERDEHEITAACDAQSFSLEEEFEFSDELRCSLDMSDEILEIEDRGEDVLLVRVHTAEDAHFFAFNAHMARLPVAFVSDSEEALEMALVLYNGRAIIDSMSDLPRETLERLAMGYGATVI